MTDIACYVIIPKERLITGVNTIRCDPIIDNTQVGLLYHNKKGSQIMNNYIAFEDMPPSAQEAYKKSCQSRKISLFVSCLGIILFIPCFGSAMSGGSDDAIAVFPFLFLLCCVHGWAHMHLHFKSLPRKLGIIGVLVWFWATYISGALASLVFIIMDIRKLFKKEPLVAPSEHKYFLESPAAQAELLAMASSELDRANSYDQQKLAEDTMENIKKLKEMFDSGIITEEEFNRKKSELLELI